MSIVVASAEYEQKRFDPVSCRPSMIGRDEWPRVKEEKVDFDERSKRIMNPSLSRFSVATTAVA
jgi:hypothetical protein